MPTEREDTCHYVDLYPKGNKGALDLSEQELAIIDRINQKIADQTSLEEIINFVFDAMEPVRASDRFSLAFLVEDGRRMMSHHVAANYDPLYLDRGYAEDFPGSSLNEVMNGTRARIIDDLRTYLQHHPHSRSTKLIIREGIRSSMTCPLVADGKAVGVAFWSSKKTYAYRDDQVLRKRAIAERLSQAVRNAQLIEQLRKANEAYTDLLGFVSHELKNPVASLLTTANLFLHGYLGELTEQQLEKFQNIKSKGEYLLGIVDQYLGLARVEGGKITPRYVEVEDIITRLVDPSLRVVEADLENRGMRLELDFPEGPLPATCDPDMMKIVVINFLNNAIKYGNEGGLIRLRAYLDGDGFHFHVWNEGPGFQREERNKLFRKFSRLQAPELIRRGGTGVGLYLCWRMVNAHGGKVRAISEQGQWADFSIHIPQPPVEFHWVEANAGEKIGEG